MPSDVVDISAVVCTLNSITSIEDCLRSLREAGVGQIVVVDAHSVDGTREIADRLADVVIEDDGVGLGNARNQGIAVTAGKFILNCGSDNVVTREALQAMLTTLVEGDFHGVSAMTVVPGGDYVSQSMNDWRRARFRPGEVAVIGTPTLFLGETLRSHPFDVDRQHSDDAELCERWVSSFGARFAIANVEILETGKASWTEIKQRCRNYGFSDYEIFRSGKQSGWDTQRQLVSLLHPLKVDLLQPLVRMSASGAVKRLPFLVAITAMRYRSWIDISVHHSSTANH